MKSWILVVPNKRKIRFAYLSGPVDGVEVYKAWSKDATLEYFGTSYLRQFFQACENYSAEGYVVTTLQGSYSRQCLGNFIIENRPTPTELSGLRYHIAYIIWTIKILPCMVRFRPDILVLTVGRSYWFFLSVLKLLGVVIIPAQHDSLWKRFSPLKKLSWRVLGYLDALFFRTCVNEVMVAAESTADQVRTLVAGKKVQIEVFLPTYRRKQFSSVLPSDFSIRPFQVMFMGRIVSNKGIYDLVEVASSLDPKEFHFHVCGEGPELSALRKKVEEEGLKAIVSCHGFLDRKKLYNIFDQAHAVIVPTTTDFEEGFNMVCAEAVLSGRPVITSAVCPALAYIKDAAIEVQPNDVKGYRDALVQLATYRKLYEEKRDACYTLQEQFYDERNSWGAKLDILLKKYISE
jgi:glycogen synthase